MSENAPDEEEEFHKITSLGEFDEKYGISWLSGCYPLRPEFIRHSDYLKSAVSYELNPLFESEVREYPDDSKEPVSGDPLPSTDISSLLGDDLVRNNGDRVSLNAATFKGKYVLVCCFHVPVLWGTKYFQTLINLCNELFSIRDDFEMVVVARMIGVADTRPVFDHFFSGFHGSVLAVPYEDPKRRHHICNLLDLGPKLEYIPCLFIDKDGSVLPPFLDYNSLEYGAEAFPFTQEILADFEAKSKQLRNGSLEQLLRPYESSPDDVSVYKVNDPDEVVNISQLRNKVVGIYMCFKGDLIPRLNKVYKKCKEKGLDFEVVVLFCPFMGSLDLKANQEGIDSLMQKEGVRGWWRLPFNNSVSMRFLGLTDRYYNGQTWGYSKEDKVIIVGLRGEILDMYGGEVIRCRGVDAYPFTREALVDSEMEKLREITLESVLVDGVFRGNDRSDVMYRQAYELVGKKKVIIFMTSLHHMDFQGLVFKYHEMKASEGTEFELVLFVRTSYLDEEDENREAREEEEDNKISEMPWYVYPRDGTRSASMIKLLERPYCFMHGSTFLGFGEDGRLNSYKGGICLDDTLWDDVNRLFCLDEFHEI